MKFSELNEVRLEKPDLKLGNEKSFYDYNEWRTGLYKVMKRITDSTGYWYVGSSQEKIMNNLEKKSPEEYAKIRSKVAQLSNLIRDAKNIEKKAKKMANEILDEIQKSKE
jgi:hypothetical protein